MRVRIKFKPREWFVGFLWYEGVCWTYPDPGTFTQQAEYILSIWLIPCFPIQITFKADVPQHADHHYKGQ